MEDLGVRQVQDWNQGHGRTGLSQSASQTFLKAWQVEVQEGDKGVRATEDRGVTFMRTLAGVGHYVLI